MNDEKQLYCSCGCGSAINPETDTDLNTFYIIKNHNRPPHMIFGEGSTKWKGGNYQSKEGFWYIYTRNHPHAKYNYVPRSHLVLEKVLGRYIQDDEIVIHLNKDPSDDRPENLKAATRAEAVRILKTLDMSDRFCISCGSFQTSLQKKNGRPHWYNHEDGVNHICNICYNRQRMHYNSRTYRNMERKQIIDNYQNIKKIENE